jgi:thiol-disulfide isomerase/thioredoxin
VSRIFLIFAAALVALMAGALLYAVRMPAQPLPPAAPNIPQPRALEVTTHPSFTLPDVSGTPRDFSDWDGKNRIVNFWATWCAPCRREIPLLKAFQDEQSGNGFQVIGIAVDFPEAVANYAEAAQFNYPVLVGEQDAMAVAESSGVQFVGLPFTMFVASDGELLSAYIGELHQTHLDQIVDIMTRLDRAEISKDEARATLDNF